MTNDDEAREAQVGTTGSPDLPTPPWAAGPGQVGAIPLAERVKRSPSAWWYLLCLAVLIAGVVISIIGVVSAAMNIGDNFVTFEGPGTQDVSISETGRQSIYLETAAGSVTGSVTIKITDKDGKELVVGPSSGSATYDINSRSGRRVAMVDVPKAGTYTVASARYDESPEPYKLQIGNIGAGAFLTAIFVPAAASTVLAIVVFVVILLLRRRSPVSS